MPTGAIVEGYQRWGYSRGVCVPTRDGAIVEGYVCLPEMGL